MTRQTLWLGVAGVVCILGSSLGMLAATAYNRAGEPTSSLELTERELTLPASDSDAADQPALTFSPVWRMEGMSHTDIALPQTSTVSIPWMTAEKSAQLGMRGAGERHRHSQVAVFLVLEFNGPSYARELTQACRNPDGPVCRRVRDTESRLYVVDASKDAAQLRERYPDPHLYAIVKGTIDFGTSGEEAGSTAAFVTGLDVGTIQGQEPLRSAKRGRTGEMAWREMGEGKPFIAAIDFGRRHEPWNAALSFGAHVDPPPVAAPSNLDEGGRTLTIR